MKVAGLLIYQNLVMAIYMLMGYILHKKKIVTLDGSRDIGKMLLYLIMPMAIMKSYIREFSMYMLRGFAISFMVSLFVLILAIMISHVFFKNKSAVQEFGAAFSNAGFIGIPLVQMTFGDEAVFYAASFVALLNILQWTYGLFIFTGDKNVVSIKKIITNPIVISLVAGLVLFAAPLEVPEMIKSVISTTAAMNGPLAMFVLGTYLAQVEIREIFKDKDSYLCAGIRLFIIPAVTALALIVLPEQYYVLKGAVLLVAAAPVGSNVAIFAQLYDKDYQKAVKDVCLSTIFSIVSMPLISMLIDVI